MTLYTIRDWAENYESADNRRTEGPLKWYMARVKMDSIGFARMTQEKDAAQLFGAWHLLLMIAANQDKDQRGKLARNGVPLTCEDLEIMTRFPAKLFERALEFFASSRIAWITAVCWDVTDKSVNPQQDAGTSQKSAPHITGEYSTVHNKTLGASLPLAPASVESKSEKDDAKTDDQWLQELQGCIAYEGVNVRAEFAKMQTWCAANHKQPTRRRFVNWLNRCERPMANQQRSLLPEDIRNAF